jgi:hypothetical protein
MMAFIAISRTDWMTLSAKTHSILEYDTIFRLISYWRRLRQAINKKARYYFIQSSLKQFHYRVLTKRQKGIVIRFLLQVTGYSRQQLTRLIQQYLNTGVVQLSDTNKPAGFKQTYTTTDIVSPIATFLDLVFSKCLRWF